MIPRTTRPSRRSVLGVAAAGLVTGCSASPGPAPAGRSAASAPPGSAQRTRAAGDSLALLARYDGTLAAHPGLGTLLRPLRAEVARHVTAFGGRVPAPSAGAFATPGRATAPAAPGSVTPAPPSAPVTGGVTVPPAPAAALTALAAAERDLGARRTADLMAAPGDLARLLASVAACAAGHAALLTAGAKNV